MITVKPEKKTVRETVCLYKDADGKETEIRVRYFSRTYKETKEYYKKMEAQAKENPNLVVFHSEVLAERLESLPDLQNEDGSAFAVTEESLSDLSTENLSAIKDAIEDHENPQKKVTKSE